MFINDERLNNNSDKINFIDKIIEFLEKEKLNIEDKFLSYDDDDFLDDDFLDDDDKKKSELMYVYDDLDVDDDFLDIESSENNAFSQSTSQTSPKIWDLTQRSTINSSYILEEKEEKIYQSSVTNKGERKPKTVLKVKFLDSGKTFVTNNAAQTFILTLFELGIEKVIEVVEKEGITLDKVPIASYQAPPDSFYSKYPKSCVKVKDGYYFMTHNSTDEKAYYLNRIAKIMNRRISIEFIEKQTK
jgi:hypothetical protein